MTAQGFSPEIEVMATCVEQIDALTPQERERVISWLCDRVRDDIAKGRGAARALGGAAYNHAETD